MTHFLYHNLGGLKFEDVTDKAGIKPTGWGQGVCAGDIDNDGYPDLFVTQWGQNVLYRNQASGKFRDETKERGLAFAKAAMEHGLRLPRFQPGRLFLDLMVVHYVDFDLTHTPRPGQTPMPWKGLPVCAVRAVFRPKPSRSIKMTDTATSPMFRTRFTCDRAEKLLWLHRLDWRLRQRWLARYLTWRAIRPRSLYYHNLGGKTFEEIGVRAGLAYNEDGREQAGMGAAAADFDGDGLLDIFKTNFADDTHTLYRNRGGNNFEDDTIDSGLGSEYKISGLGHCIS